MTGRIATIDFGTNTARLLIADISPSEVCRHLHIEREIVRMGGGFSRERGLSEEAWERGLACLKRFSEIIKNYEVQAVRAVATSAVRDAVNGKDFVRCAQRETGIQLRVIDGLLEGELTLAGVLSGLDRSSENIILFDVGGGSTEFSFVSGSRTLLVKSLPLGVVRLTEGKITSGAMEEKICRELEHLAQELPGEAKGFTPENSLLVGTAGTATTLAAINRKMEVYDYRLVNNCLISRDEIVAIYDRLLPLAPAERLNVPGLEQGREDLIIAGILITLRTMDQLGFSEMKVSDYGLLEGLAVAGERLSDN